MVSVHAYQVPKYAHRQQFAACVYDTRRGPPNTWTHKCCLQTNFGHKNDRLYNYLLYGRHISLHNTRMTDGTSVELNRGIPGMTLFITENNGRLTKVKTNLSPSIFQTAWYYWLLANWISQSLVDRNIPDKSVTIMVHLNESNKHVADICYP